MNMCSKNRQKKDRFQIPSDLDKYDFILEEEMRRNQERKRSHLEIDKGKEREDADSH